MSLRAYLGSLRTLKGSHLGTSQTEYEGEVGFSPSDTLSFVCLGGASRQRDRLYWLGRFRPFPCLQLGYLGPCRRVPLRPSSVSLFLVALFGLSRRDRSQRLTRGQTIPRNTQRE